MRISKFLSSSIAIVALIALLLVACAAPAAPAPQPTQAPAAQATTAPAPAQATEAPAAQPTAAPAAGEPVTVNWWHISTAADQKAKFQELADAYMKEHPNVKIEITVLENEAFKAKLATAMQSGAPPDIFQSWGGGVLRQYAEAGLVQDLTSAMAEDGWGDSISAGPLSLYTVDGKVYGVPWNAGMVGFWYNKELFEQAGITKTPETWAEFLDTVKKLKDAGITPIALAGKDKWPGHFYWVYLATREGGQEAFEKAYNRDGSFADPPFVKAGEDLKQLVDLQPFQEGFLAADYPEHRTVFANGKAAMELMGQWAPGANRDQATDVEKFNNFVSWFPFPQVEGGAGDPSDALGGGDGYAIGKNAPPEAIDFVRFLVSKDTQTELVKAGIAVPPTVKGADEALDDPNLKEIVKRLGEAKYYQLYYDQYLPPAVGQTVNDATQGLFAGTMSPEQVAEAIEAAAAAELK